MVTVTSSVISLSPLKVILILIAACLSFILLNSVASPPSTATWKPSKDPIKTAKERDTDPEILKEPSKATPGHQKATLQDIRNDTLGFEKLLVLNLPERSDKRDAITLAASLTNMTITFVEGIKGDTVLDKTLPWGQENRQMTDPMIGSWRAHMNAIRSVVENRWSSALIVEDDADWDIYLKSQLLDFAHGTRYLQNQSVDDLTHSPYGDGWDLLWVGHCEDYMDDRDKRTYVIQNDPTVPASRKLQINNHDFLANWPDHSRIVHVAGTPICTFAYAVSFKGAQKILYSLSVKELRGLFDNALSMWCSGGDRRGRCLSAHPPYFAQHRVRGKPGKNSDNNPDMVAHFQGDATAETINIRFSTRMNIEQLLAGSSDFHDSYPRD